VLVRARPQPRERIVRSTYTLTLSGCDDATYIDVNLTDAEHALLVTIAEMTEAASSYGCQPVLNIGDAHDAAGDAS